MKKFIAVLLLASLTALAHTQEVKAKQLQGRSANLFVIEVGLSGKACHFIVDTGAAMTMISKEMGQNTIVIHKYSVVDSTGHDSPIDVTHVKLTVGSAKTWVNAFVSDMAAISRASGMKIDGILGQDLLSQFRSVTFNYRAKTITFQQ